MMTPAYRYLASLVRAIDGDTYVLDVDLGFKIHHHVTVRLRGIDTPEMNTAEGKAARLFASAVLADAASIVVETHKDTRSFERWVADVYANGEHMAEILRRGGQEKAVVA